VELDKTESFAAFVVLADNVGGLNVQALEDLGQTCVIHAEGEIGHEQSVARWGSGSPLGIIPGGTGGPGAALTGGTTSGGLVTTLLALVATLGGSACVVALYGSTASTLVPGSTPPEAASTERTAATACTSSLGSFTTSGVGGTVLGVGVLGGLLLTRASNLNVDLALIDELLVESFHGLLGLLLGLHLYEPVPKGAGPAGNDARGSNFSDCLELLGEVSVIGLERQISNEYLGPPHDSGSKWQDEQVRD